MCNLLVYFCRHLKLRPHACALCESSFTKRSDLKRHVKALHQVLLPDEKKADGDSKPFLCTQCDDKRFATRQGLGKHVSRKHSQS